MMPCPNCSKKSQVLDSRLRQTGRSEKKHVYIWRRRVCLNKKCGLRWSTVEGREAAAGHIGTSEGGNIIDQAAYDQAALILTKLASDMRRVKTRRKLRAFNKASKKGMPAWMLKP